MKNSQLEGVIENLEQLRLAISELEQVENQPINRTRVSEIWAVLDQILAFFWSVEARGLTMEHWMQLLFWQNPGQEEIELKSRMTDRRERMVVEEVMYKIQLHLISLLAKLEQLMQLVQEVDADSTIDQIRDINARFTIGIIWLRLLLKPHEIRFSTPAALILDYPEERMVHMHELGLK
jgi:hypothetical protein